MIKIIKCKTKRLTGLLAIGLAMTLLIAGCGVPQGDYDSIVAEKDKLQSDNSALKADRDTLKTEHDALVEAHEQLLADTADWRVLSDAEKTATAAQAEADRIAAEASAAKAAEEKAAAEAKAAADAEKKAAEEATARAAAEEAARNPIEVRDVTFWRSDGSYIKFEATIYNKGDKKYTAVRTRVVGKDVNGNVVNSTTAYAMGTHGEYIAPGESAQFDTLLEDRNNEIVSVEVSVTDYDEKN
jgi:hypothetical protein